MSVMYTCAHTCMYAYVYCYTVTKGIFIFPGFPNAALNSLAWSNAGSRNFITSSGRTAAYEIVFDTYKNIHT